MATKQTNKITTVAYTIIKDPVRPAHTHTVELEVSFDFDKPGRVTGKVTKFHKAKHFGFSWRDFIVLTNKFIVKVRGCDV